MAGITKHKTKAADDEPATIVKFTRERLPSYISVYLYSFFPRHSFQRQRCACSVRHDCGKSEPPITNLIKSSLDSASHKTSKKIGTCGVYICRSKPERLAKGWMRFHQTAQVEGDSSQKHIQPRGMISTLSDITSSFLSSRQPRTRWNSSSRHHHKWSQEAQFAVLARHRPLPSVKSVGEWDAVFGPPFGL